MMGCVTLVMLLQLIALFPVLVVSSNDNYNNDNNYCQKPVYILHSQNSTVTALDISCSQNNSSFTSLAFKLNNGSLEFNSSSFVRTSLLFDRDVIIVQAYCSCALSGVVFNSSIARWIQNRINSPTSSPSIQPIDYCPAPLILPLVLYIYSISPCWCK